MLQEFLVSHYIGGPKGVDNPAIEGLFIDDGWAGGYPTEEDTHAVVDMGLSKAEIAKVVAGWRANEAAAQAKILASKAFNWQLLNCAYKPNATHTCAGSPQTAPGREQNASSPPTHFHSHYHVSMKGRFLPSRSGGTGMLLRPIVIHSRVSAGSITLSMPKKLAAFTAFASS